MNFVERAAKSLGYSSIAVLDYQVINDKAKVLIRTNRETTPYNLRHSICRAFNNELKPIESSFRQVAPRIHCGFVRLNRIVEPFTVTNKVELANNLFMDLEDETLWEVETSEDGQPYLVKRNVENLEELLTVAKVRDNRYQMYQVPVQSGDFIAYVANRVKYGYAVPAGTMLKVFEYKGSVKTIDPRLVVDSMVTDIVIHDWSKVKDYYANLYKDTDFYNELIKVIDQRATA